MTDENLPSFRKPPVVETVLGVQFDLLPGLRNAHLGAFWKRILAGTASVAAPDDRWTETVDVPRLGSVFERFGDEEAWLRPEIALRIGQEPSVRLQIRNRRGDAMIQVQNGRLHYNWIGTRGREYCRYRRVRPEFDRVYREWREFLQSEGLGIPRENQWEVTYVNHIPRGSVWDEPRDWPRLFKGLPGLWADPSFVRLESVLGSWHFEIPPRRGRLHVDLKHAKTKEPDSVEILRLTLTARGAVGPEDAGGVSLVDGLDLGRRAVVLTFRDITSDAAHAFWEVEHDRGG